MKLVGVETVGIGMDYVEGFQDQANVVAPPSVVTLAHAPPGYFWTPIRLRPQPYPLGVEGVAKLQTSPPGSSRAAKEADVAAIMGGNWLRCIEKFCG